MPSRPLRLAFLAEPNALAAREWMSYFSDSGHAVSLIVRAESAVLPGLDPRIAVYRMPSFRGRVRGRLAAFGARRAIKAALRSIDPDVLHVHDLTTGFEWIARVSGFHPYVLTPWGSDLLAAIPTTRPSRLIRRLSFVGADLVTVNSTDLRGAAIRAGARPARVQMVQFGVDVETFRPREPDRALAARLGLEGRRVVFSPRRMWPIYDHLSVVEAIAALPDDVVLLLTAWTASPTYLETLRERVQELRMDHRVTIVPMISRAEMASYYSLADVVVSVPRSDATAVTILEAMACGRPVVVTDLPSPREWIEEVAKDAIVPVGDVEAIRMAIWSSLTLPSDESAVRAALARRIVVERAERTANMERMDALYQSLASRSRASRR